MLYAVTFVLLGQLHDRSKIQPADSCFRGDQSAAEAPLELLLLMWWVDNSIPVVALGGPVPVLRMLKG